MDRKGVRGIKKFALIEFVVAEVAKKDKGGYVTTLELRRTMTHDGNGQKDGLTLALFNRAEPLGIVYKFF